MKFVRIMLIALGFGLVTVALGFLTSKPAPAQAPPPVVPVTVVNTPLPVQGKVSALVAGTVNANVTNTVPVSGTVGVSSVGSLPPVSGTVAVSSLPAVSLNNTNTSPLFVRDVDNPANEPFATSLCYGFGMPTPCFFNPATPPPSSFVVPTTTSDGKTVKELVIQSIDGGCAVTGVGVLDVTLITMLFQNVISNNSSVAHFMPFSSNPSVTSARSLFWATPMQIMASPNSTVFFVVDTNVGTSFGCTMNLSGYYVTQ